MIVIVLVFFFEKQAIRTDNNIVQWPIDFFFSSITAAALLTFSCDCLIDSNNDDDEWWVARVFSNEKKNCFWWWWWLMYLASPLMPAYPWALLWLLWLVVWWGVEAPVDIVDAFFRKLPRDTACKYKQGQSPRWVQQGLFILLLLTTCVFCTSSVGWEKKFRRLFD